MSAIALTMNTPSVDATATTTRRRYTMPTTGAPRYVRIFSADDCFLELVDAADGSAKGAAFETLKGAVEHFREIRRGEFAISSSQASSSIEVRVSSIPIGEL